MVGTVLRVRYELTQLLSEGPIFTAYSARDRLHGRDTCVRIIRPPFDGDPDFLRKLVEVVLQYSSSRHPGIESMFEVDDDDGRRFLVSEFTKGQPLGDRIRKLAPFSVPVAVSTAISLCEDLEALHTVGLAHGDVSGQNLISLPDGQVRLQLPGMWQAYAASPVAASLVLPGMSPYLAPEISAGGMPSPASDVYATGVLLYELLTGRLPYNADTPVSMALKHASDSIPSCRMFNPAVPAVLDEIVKKALAKGPSERYPTGGALLADLRVLQDALRFGRTVTWPISRSTSEEPTMPKARTQTSGGPRSQPRPAKVDREPPDVPLFMWIPIAFFGAVAATLLGVWIYFNLSKPTLVKVPSLAGLTLAEARERLKPMKLSIEVDSQKVSERVPLDHIISTDPGPDERVREGSPIRAVVSSGSRLVQVPDLKGNSVDQARSILQTARLQLDDAIETRRSLKIEPGLVMSQSPPPGAKVDQTTKVKITVSTGDGGTPEMGVEPADSGPVTNLYTVRVKLAGLQQPVTLRIDIVDDEGTKTVYEQEHEPEETVELTARGSGRQVTFNIYYDNELVRTVKQNASDAKPVLGGEGRAR